MAGKGGASLVADLTGDLREDFAKRGRSQECRAAFFMRSIARAIPAKWWQGQQSVPPSDH
jgi:hypothetical protein